MTEPELSKFQVLQYLWFGVPETWSARQSMLSGCIRAKYVLYLVKAQYTHFDPTLASEKLAELHNLHVSASTLRSWMLEAKIWTTRKAKPLPNGFTNPAIAGKALAN